MLTIEHYNNLMNYIGYAEMSLDYMIEIDTVTNNEELMRFVIDIQKNHEEIIDILDFLVVKPVYNNNR